MKIISKVWAYQYYTLINILLNTLFVIILLTIGLKIKGGLLLILIGGILPSSNLYSLLFKRSTIIKQIEINGDVITIHFLNNKILVQKLKNLELTFENISHNYLIVDGEKFRINRDLSNNKELLKGLSKKHIYEDS